MRPDDPDIALAAITSRQHGVFTRRQALDAGISASRLQRWIARGVVERLHPGVYRLASAPDTRVSRFLAGVLVVGAGAALFGPSAAFHWGFEGAGLPAELHVVVRGQPRFRHLRGVRVHGSKLLTPRDVTIHRGVPVTVPVRTLSDYAPYADERQRRLALAHVMRRFRVSAEVIRADLDRLGRPRGAAGIRALLDEVSPQVRFTRSEFERLYLEVTVDAGLPEPTMNHAIRDYYGQRRLIDAAYIPERVPVELDGEATHGRGFDLVEDRKRQNAIVLAGWSQPLRFTWWDLTEDADRVVAEVRAALEAARSSKAR